MAELTPTLHKRQANAITLGPADAAGDNFANNGKRSLLIENASAGQRTVTFVTQSTVDSGAGGLAVADLAIAIPAGELHYLGPFPANIYNDANGKVQMTYDDHTDLKVAVIERA